MKRETGLLHETDTIVAQATPPGRGGIGVIRISGPATPDLARAILGNLPAARHAQFSAFLDSDGQAIDTGIALYFPSPHSFTGEDVLELQGHGGPAVTDLLVQRCLALGARLARAGEFTERAFLNDKLDLAQAEAVADLIDAGSASAARAAIRSLQGEFSALTHALTGQVVELRMYVEAAMDFPEEEIDFLADRQVTLRLEEIGHRLSQILRGATQGLLVREGMTVVLAGRPNVGKSSLLNRLAGHDAAIVTAIPGTTRDVLRERIHLDGLPLHVIDTAGLRESSDPVEQEGVRRARAEMERADCILLLLDDRQGMTAQDSALLEELPTGPSRWLLHNKCDLSGQKAETFELLGSNAIRLSALTGEGLDLLREALKRHASYQPGEGSFIARRRHLDALNRAQAALARGKSHLEGRRAGELLAEELRVAQQALGEITGEVTSDDLLGAIFSSFCIGK